MELKIPLDDHCAIVHNPLVFGLRSWRSPKDGGPLALGQRPQNLTVRTTNGYLPVPFIPYRIQNPWCVYGESADVCLRSSVRVYSADRKNETQHSDLILKPDQFSVESQVNGYEGHSGIRLVRTASAPIQERRPWLRIPVRRKGFRIG